MATTMRAGWAALLLPLLTVVAAGVAACADDNGSSSGPGVGENSDAGGGAPEGGGDDGGGADGAAGACAPARPTDRLPARLAVRTSTSSASKLVFVSDLFGRFKANCGGCHVDAALGNLQVGPLDFADKVDERSVDRILSGDTALTMPPVSAGGRLASSRTPEDPVMALASLLKTWIAAGRPRDVFELPADASPDGGSPFVLSNALADALSNIGDCIPSPSIVGTERERSDALDAYIAGLVPSTDATASLAQRVGLPERLDQTDLFTLDSETLARHGVIAYVPTYPLWTNGAGKLRHVRVPRGQSIHFDKATQNFVIPENTRFYKTFLAKVVDVDGVDRWRKIETRVIVVRYHTAPLAGTYVWNEDETQATLLTDPLRDGTPFGDRILTYVADEPAAAAVRATKPRNLQFALQDAKAIRHWPLPGSSRCIECHVGAPNGSFILAFTPLQVMRRPLGEGGVYEPAGPDDLSQLQRLIDYKIVTGLSSASDVTKLEDAEGSRKPRNDHELLAQAYMMSNCASCHNPTGIATLQNPVLAKVLNFWPGPEGGVFQFPLETMSPRITRGLGGAVPVPYLTPSLMDVPSNLGTDYFTPKWEIDEATMLPSNVIYAPWRSLIFRSVDTPFTYSDDLALFPHMPMDGAGIDCRAGQIMADWMVSIPAARKNPNLPEFAVRVGDAIAGGVGAVDDTPQPYVEVLPSDPGYAKAVAAAQHRLEIYHQGHLSNEDGVAAHNAPSRYAFCPDVSDVLDPAVLKDPKNHPVPIDDKRGVWEGNPLALAMPSDGVPDRPHFVALDLTDPPGDWNPRRTDWQDVLVHGASPTPVTELLQRVVVSPAMRSFATSDVPMGLWTKKAECKFAGVPTVASFDATRPKWMDKAGLARGATDPVYTQSPGAAVFNMICANCHGEKGDSLGRMAQNLATMSGGDARVANFKTGFFGPEATPGASISRVFGAVASAGATADDWGARYMTWMALGGTQRAIPASILAMVSNTEVFGTRRLYLHTAESANMLSTAKTLCGAVLLPPGHDGTIAVSIGDASYKDVSPLIAQNGDANLWQQLCAIDNAQPVRAIYAEWNTAQYPGFQIRGNFEAADHGLHASFDLYPASAFPAGTLVGAPGGKVVPLASDNPWPWCLRVPLDAAKRANAEAYVNDPAHYIDGKPIPFCPESVVPKSNQVPPNDGRMSSNDIETWATRGAINAGVAVYLYVDKLARGVVHAKPRYDACEQLP